MKDMTITEFLTARLDEDEAVARAADVKQGDPSWQRHGPVALSDPRAFRIRSERDSRPIALVQDVSGDDEDPDRETAILDGAAAAEHIARHDPARVLAEVEAKRRIVGKYEEAREAAETITLAGLDSPRREVENARYSARRAAYYDDLMDLVSVYADHPDYDESWRI